jgi:hypothetical protein
MNGAVADAVKEAAGQAVREALQAVLGELLRNPDLQNLMQGRMASPATIMATPQAEQPRRKGWCMRCLEWLGSRVRAAGRACSAAVQFLWNGTRRGAAAIHGTVTTVWANTIAIRRHKYTILGGLAALLMVGFAAYHASPLAVSVSTTAASVLSALLMRARDRFGDSLRALGRSTS